MVEDIIHTTNINKRGTVTIPQTIRNKLWIKDGDLLEIKIEDNGVCFHPIDIIRKKPNGRP